MIKLIIFDLDGTLIDSLDDLTEAVNFMLASFDRPLRSKAEIRTMIGQGARNLVQLALGDDASAQLVDQALPLFLDYNMLHIADHTRLYPGVAELLPSLQQAGYQLALLSNKDEGHCRLLLQQLGLADYFAAILGADSLPERKPSPLPVLTIMERFSLTPAETLLVGDSSNDFISGKAAAVTTIGCCYGYGSEAELAEADFRVESALAILDMIVHCLDRNSSC